MDLGKCLMIMEVDKPLAVLLSEASFSVGISYEDNSEEKKALYVGL